jgi:RNA polymerase sigma-70 factor, ECF subfamily
MEFEFAGRLSQQRLDKFVQAYLPCERRIMAYISSLVPNRTDAEDITQEVCLVLWQKFDDFAAGTDFAAWACRIAFLKVLNHRRKQPRPIALSEEVIDSVSAEFLQMNEAVDAEQRALGPCLEELTTHQRDLVQFRHRSNSTLKLTADKFGISVVTLRKRLQAIYRQLMECVTQKLDQEDL